MNVARALGLSLLALAIVYVPAFALVGFLRPAMNDAVPMIIVVTAALACILAAGYALWRRIGPGAFGLWLAARRFFVYALAVSIPLSALAQFATMHAHETGPLAGLTLPFVMAGFYFLICAPIQEEFIFRGLVQTVFATEIGAQWPAVGAAALLFALVHLVIGPVTAAAALVLGLVAGELRRRSGSLLPAILCHAIFNLPGLLF
ncbi:MAG TPA: CPBP family intramembrane glutamic endopeptidase [Rhizomicrobium sp.]